MRKFGGDKLLVATHNRGKLEEIAALLKPYGITCVSAGDLGLAHSRLAAGNAFRTIERGRRDAIRVALGSTRIEELRRGLSTIAAMLSDAPEVLLPTI